MPEDVILIEAPIGCGFNFMVRTKLLYSLVDNNVQAPYLALSKFASMNLNVSTPGRFLHLTLNRNRAFNFAKTVRIAEVITTFNPTCGHIYS